MRNFTRRKDAIRTAQIRQERYVIWDNTFKVYAVTNNPQGCEIIWESK